MTGRILWGKRVDLGTTRRNQKYVKKVLANPLRLPGDGA